MGWAGREVDWPTEVEMAILHYRETPALSEMVWVDGGGDLQRGVDNNESPSSVPTKDLSHYM